MWVIKETEWFLAIRKGPAGEAVTIVDNFTSYTWMNLEFP